MNKKRCSWVKLKNPLYVDYHDTEWGVPVFDDQKLFEFIVLESAQAGLSLELILKKREGYRKAFKGFNPKKVSKMTEENVQMLLQDESIVRNQLKIRSTINNAQCFLKVQKEFGSFSAYMWGWKNTAHYEKDGEVSPIPKTTSPLAILMAQDMKKRGFKFLGPIVWYAHMQAVGMVNDHDKECFRFNEVCTLGLKRTGYN